MKLTTNIFVVLIFCSSAYGEFLDHPYSQLNNCIYLGHGLQTSPNSAPLNPYSGPNSRTDGLMGSLYYEFPGFIEEFDKTVVHIKAIVENPIRDIDSFAANMTGLTAPPGMWLTGNEGYSSYIKTGPQSMTFDFEVNGNDYSYYNYLYFPGSWTSPDRVVNRYTSYEVWAVAVPEPSTIVLLCTGLIGCLIIRSYKWTKKYLNN